MQYFIHITRVPLLFVLLSTGYQIGLGKVRVLGVYNSRRNHDNVVHITDKFWVTVVVKVYSLASRTDGE